jgi:hypothetical protein
VHSRSKLRDAIGKIEKQSEVIAYIFPNDLEAKEYKRAADFSVSISLFLTVHC